MVLLFLLISLRCLKLWMVLVFGSCIVSVVVCWLLCIYWGVFVIESILFALAAVVSVALFVFSFVCLVVMLGRYLVQMKGGDTDG